MTQSQPAESSASQPQPQPTGPRSRPPLIAGAAAAVVAVVVLVLVLTGGDDSDAPEGGSRVEAREVSPEDLRDFAADETTPVYWIGQVEGHKLELQRTDRGYVYVRYLPDVAPIGDEKPNYTTIATYPVADAYGIASRGSRARGRVQRRVPGGGVAVYYRGRPTSVYVAYPEVDALIEVYDPQAQEARSLALSGQVQPVE